MQTPSRSGNGYRNERAFKAAILRHLRVEGFYAWSNAASSFGKVGLPDIMAVRGGRLLAIEAKQPGNVPTEIQIKTIADLNDAGAVAIVAWDMGHVKEVIRTLDAFKTLNA